MKAIFALVITGVALLGQTRPGLSATAMTPDPNMPRPIAARDSVFIEELTWLEVRDAIRAGKTTVIIATGGVEQNGPYLAAGKHNYVLRGTTESIARKLGNTLVAPIVAFVPEGDISPPTSHMKYPSTISLRAETFKALLTDIAESLVQHGFQRLIFIGDSGGNQTGMKEVTAALSRKWSAEKATFHFIPEYYDFYNTGALSKWLETQGIHEKDEGYHDNVAITTMMMTVDPSTVRMAERRAKGKFSINGVPLDPADKMIALGKKVIAYRTEITLEAIRKSLPPQRIADPGKGQVVRIKVHGAGLEGNLSGDSPDRDVTVYLPPSYAKNPARRYPVVYLLHGFTDSDEKWMGSIKHFVNVPEVADRALVAGSSKEMIVVMPNAFTRFQGSMYSSSAVIGDWEGFVANELVAYVDGHYRTIAKPESRGLAGHSMGGYGALRIAMKRPGVFSSVYALSPCCMAPPGLPRASAGPSKAEMVKSVAEIEKADFGTKAALASAAAWSPNPKNPPLFIDLPTVNGVPQPGVLARWSANAPLAMVDQYAGNLKRLKGLAFDAGDQEAGIGAASKALDQLLAANDVPHSFEIYEGNHTNHIADRIEMKVLWFFTRNLVFPSGK